MRIAVVGAGVAGLLAGRLLADEHEVAVFEAADRIGGHIETIPRPDDPGRGTIDIGVCLFNRHTSPTFFQLAESLGLAFVPADTSFRLHDHRDRSGFSGTLDRLWFSRPSRLSAALLWTARDVRRFKREARTLLATDAGTDMTISEFVTGRRFSRRFVQTLLIPLIMVVWGASPSEARDFSIRAAMRWLMGNQPGWCNLAGGTPAYLAALTAPLDGRIRLRSPIEWIRRSAEAVQVCSRGETPQTFDHVVLATAPDVARRMLRDISDVERDVLGQFSYRDFRATVHSDASVLGGRSARDCASLIVHVEDGVHANGGAVEMIHNLTRMFALEDAPPVLASWGDTQPVRPERILHAMETRLPILTPRAVAAQARWAEINARGRTSYCGAYWGQGEHEDAIRSALAVCRQFGVSLTAARV